MPASSEHPAGAGAIPPAQPIADEPRKALMVLGELDKVPMPETPTTAGAGSRLRLGYRRGVDVEAPDATVLVIGALARFTSFATIEDDPVHARAIALARNEPNAVLEPYFVGVVPEQSDAALLAGGWLRTRRYTTAGHEVSPSWSGPRGVLSTAGATSYRQAYYSIFDEIVVHFY
jgi:hypothetical protein